MFPNCTFRPMNKGNTNFGSGNPDINKLIAVIKYINQNLQKYFVKYPQKSKQTKLGDFYGLWRHLVTSALEFGTWTFSKLPLQRDIFPRRHGRVPFPIAICPNLGVFKEHIKISLSIQMKFLQEGTQFFFLILYLDEITLC